MNSNDFIGTFDYSNEMFKLNMSLIHSLWTTSYALQEQFTFMLFLLGKLMTKWINYLYDLFCSSGLHRTMVMWMKGKGLYKCKHWL